MKKINLPTPMLITAVVAAFLAVFLSGMIVKGPKPGSLTATKVDPVPASFPDVKNDPLYNSFLNTDSIDPTQAIPIGNSQNSTPFNGAP